MRTLIICAIVLMAGSAHAGTIYLCKAYNGATFWAANHCNQHNALIDRIEYVADGVPWAQQVQQAEQARSGRSQLVQTQTADVQRSQRCGQLAAERAKIEGRYTNWQWQPPEVINPDQQRMRGLRAELSANQCSTQ